MARTYPRQAKAIDPTAAPHHIVASAASRGGSWKKSSMTDGGLLYSRESWQAEAFRHLNICGELHYAVSWYSNAISRAKLSVASLGADGELTPVTSGPGVNLLQEVKEGLGGEAAMLRRMAAQRFVAGEMYLVKIRDKVWEIASVAELSGKPGQWILDQGAGNKVTVTNKANVRRMWTPSPEKVGLADSPVRAALPSLREIEALDLNVQAQLRSRLAGAGILWVPSEITLPAAPGAAADGTANGIMSLLSEAMQASLGDPGSPASLVPIVVSAPGEFLDKVKHLTFWEGLEANAVAQRTSAVRRLALAVDLPPEVLMGMGDVNHWGQWQVEETTIKAHIEPALDGLTESLTDALFKENSGVPEDQVITWDTSELRLRPNRSQEAIELYDRGIINEGAVIRETGFAKADLMSKKEYQQWLIQRIAGGSATPAQVEQALQLLGVKIETEGEGETRETRPSPSLEDHPSNDPPEEASVAAVTAAVEVLVYRALERAGNKIKTQLGSGASIKGVSACDLYLEFRAQPSDLDRLIKDAWSFADRVLPCHKSTHQELLRAMDVYTRGLLHYQERVDRSKIRSLVVKALSQPNRQE